ncbi:MAG: iron complex outermembrane receptor protein, partial [Bacteroidia bacterium]
KEYSQGPTCVLQNRDASLPNLVFPQQPNFADACQESEALRDDRKISFNSDLSVFEIESSMFALTLRWMVADDIEFRSITGYSRWDNVYVNDDSDGSRAIIVSGGSKAVQETLEGSGFEVEDDDRWQITQEFKFTGSALNERLQYTVGVFASSEHLPSVLGNQLVGPGGIGGIPFSFVTGLFVPVPGLSGALGSTADQASVVPFAEWLGESSSLRNDSRAVFGEFTLELAEWLELTLGGRYTTETRDRETLVTEVDTDELGRRLGATYAEEFGVFTPISRAQFDAQFDDKRTLPLKGESTVIGDSREYTEFTPSATLSLLAPGEWLEATRLNSFLAFLSYSQGFKAGGIDARGQELISVEPEFVTNYELGFKLDAVDSRFRFNASIFHTEWEDMQILTNELGDSITGTEILQFFTNAGASTIDGVEIESAFTFANWFVNVNASYLDAKFKDFMGNAVTPFVGEERVDRSGEPFFVTPELTYSVSAYYKLMTPVGMFIPRLSANYRDEVFTGLDFLADKFDTATIEDVTLFDARLIYQPSEKIQVTAYIENLTDEVYYTSGFSNSGALGAGLMINGKPRTFGLDVSVEFY